MTTSYWNSTTNTLKTLCTATRFVTKKNVKYGKMAIMGRGYKILVRSSEAVYTGNQWFGDQIKCWKITEFSKTEYNKMGEWTKDTLEPTPKKKGIWSCI